MKIDNVDIINKVMRNEILAISGLDPKFVRDATTEYGVDLDKNPADSIFYSIESSDTLILFELTPAEIQSNMSEKNENSSEGNITYYMYFNFDVIVYGDNSTYSSLQLSSRFRSEEVRDDLIAQGIHVASVSNIKKIEEFVNGVIWLRNDFTVMIGCEVDIKKVKIPYEFESYGQMRIYDE